MSRYKGNADHDRAMRAFAESEESSDGEDGLDIVHTTRKALDLSQYIEGLWIPALQSCTSC